MSQPMVVSSDHTLHSTPTLPIHTYPLTHPPPSHTPLTHLTYTLITLTHTLTHLISLVKLGKLLHLLLLQASWDLFDVVCEDGDDPMEDGEHGLWDDL